MMLLPVKERELEVQALDNLLRNISKVKELEYNGIEGLLQPGKTRADIDEWTLAFMLDEAREEWKKLISYTTDKRRWCLVCVKCGSAKEVVEPHDKGGEG